MAVNKVQVNGETVLDLTNDSVTPERLTKGTTAHNAAGERIVGTYTAPVTSVNGETGDVVVAKAPFYLLLTLTAAGWDSDGAQTVAAQGVVASEAAQLIMPMPETSVADNQTAYIAAGVLCTGQGTNTLTFTCQTTPDTDLTVYIYVQPL
mgnify:FL=1